MDEIGFKFGLSREVNETLNMYRHRLVKIIQGTMHREKESFYKSLGYITALSDENIFEIDKVNAADNIKIDISSNRIRIYLNGSLSYKNRFENLKFLINLKNELDSLNYISVKVLPENDLWRYKRCENLMPCSSERQYLNLRVKSQVQKLPKEHILEVHDQEGDFLNNLQAA